MSSIQEWGNKVDWKKRVKAVCKPCWELKYCPYGPLVEEFPVKEKEDDHKCRIFGHDCPVFYVAEPFTETKELRDISRNIPRPVQFRVLKRDNQICRQCGQAVQDEEIEFDHIIPFSKGGSSDENNIRLLCSTCNRKRSNNFEDEYLVRDSRDHIMKPSNIEIIDFLLDLIDFYHEFVRDNQEKPSLSDYDEFTDNDTELTNAITSIAKDIIIFFKSEKPKEMRSNLFNALKYRWGFVDSFLYSINEVSLKFEVDLEKIIIEEKYFIQLIGWNIPLSKGNKKKWETK
ncbi:HNH endonuclease [Virgibacillus salexigens]|uniref:HNH endonuclease n=1 Tax=Virgibacillus salexigens TaxID=61016 RepID=UPI00190C14D0|nr:HNH endonuclease signature motif containing protein [Virgibacillus salexigens]